MPRSVLVDGDTLVYRCGFAAEKTEYKVETQSGYYTFDSAKDAKEYVAKEGGVIWTRKEIEPLDHCLSTVKAAINRIGDRFDFETFEIWLSPSVGNFRERIATRAKYKGNRDFAARPKWHKDIIAYLKDYHGAKVAVGMEADDALAMGMVGNPDSVCVSNDKDLLQIPGTHFNPWTEELVKVNKKQAQFNFYTQILTGDQSDNIPGLEGCGPVGARKLLEGASSPWDLWSRVLAAYKDKYGNKGEEYAVETARLVYLKRSPEDEWKAPEPR